jgi:predicted Zn-dependent peptidase
VKIGSIVEEEEERGVAHILEHLAFSATSVRNSLSVENRMTSTSL